MVLRVRVKLSDLVIRTSRSRTTQHVVQPTLLHHVQRWEQQRGDADLDGSTVGPRAVTHHERISRHHSQYVERSGEYQGVRFLYALLEGQRVCAHQRVETGSRKYGAQIDVDVADDRGGDSGFPQRGQGGRDVVGERVAPHVRLHGVQRGHQVLIQPSTGQDVPVGLGVQRGIRVDPGAVEGSNQRGEHRDQGLGLSRITLNQHQCVVSPSSVVEPHRESATPVEQDRAEAGCRHAAIIAYPRSSAPGTPRHGSPCPPGVDGGPVENVFRSAAPLRGRSRPSRRVNAFRGSARPAVEVAPCDDSRSAGDPPAVRRA